jgi:hypothetical protein
MILGPSLRTLVRRPIDDFADGGGAPHEVAFLAGACRLMP